MSRKTLLWALAALSGVALTAGIAWATSQLTSQRIGLSSEPQSAAGGLAPSYVATRPPAPAPSATGKTHGPKAERRAAPRSRAVGPVPPRAIVVTHPPPPSPSAPAPSGAVAPPSPSPPQPGQPAAGTRAGDDSQDHGPGEAAGKREASSTPASTGSGSAHGRDD
jgi:hypothetical protein